MRILITARSLVVAATIAVVPLIAFASPAHADAVCSDGCSVDTGVQTPAGLVTVSATSDNVVTVHLDPGSPRTLVLGIPFEIPPGPPALPGYTRTSVATTSAGTVIIDTIVIPPGPPARLGLPNVVVISIHPPSPCRAHTSGSTVTFTPVAPPT